MRGIAYRVENKYGEVFETKNYNATKENGNYIQKIILTPIDNMSAEEITKAETHARKVREARKKKRI